MPYTYMWLTRALLLSVLMAIVIASIGCRVASRQVEEKSGEAVAQQIAQDNTPTPPIEIIVADEYQTIHFGRDGDQYSIQLPIEWVSNIEYGREAMTSDTDVLMFVQGSMINMSAFRFPKPANSTLDNAKEAMSSAMEQLPDRELISLNGTQFLGEEALILKATGEAGGIIAYSTQVIYLTESSVMYFQCQRGDNAMEYQQTCQTAYDSIRKR